MRKIGFIAMATLLLAGCPGERADETAIDTTQPTIDAAPPMTAAEVPTAMAILIDAQGDTVGRAVFREQTEGGVLISVEARGLPPGERAIHLHEVGQCDPPSFQSAGGHFEETGRAHGFDHPEGPHAGDLRNIQVAADGTVRTEFVNDRVTLRSGEPHSLLDADGTSLVIHAEADDYVSQPAGDAGDRIVCGVVQANGA